MTKGVSKGVTKEGGVTHTSFDRGAVPGVGGVGEEVVVQLTKGCD